MVDKMVLARYFKSIVLLCVMVLVSCNNRDYEIISQAEKATLNILEEIKKGEFNTVTKNYSNIFFEYDLSKEQWSSILERKRNIIGDLKSYEIELSTIEENLGKETFVVLVYKVYYEKDSILEKFSVKINNDESCEVIGHDIISDSLNVVLNGNN